LYLASNSVYSMPYVMTLLHYFWHYYILSTDTGTSKVWDFGRTKSLLCWQFDSTLKKLVGALIHETKYISLHKCPPPSVFHIKFEKKLSSRHSKLRLRIPKSEQLLVTKSFQQLCYGSSTTVCTCLFLLKKDSCSCVVMFYKNLCQNQTNWLVNPTQ